MGKLGQLLVARGWITVQQLTRALQNQNSVGGRLGTCLLEMDVLGEDLLARSLSEQLGVPAAVIEDLRGIPDEVLRLIPEKLARRCRAIPFRLAGGRLDVATQDPRNLVCQDEIAFACGRRVKVHVLHELRIFEALQRYYGEECPPRYTLLLDRLNRARYLWGARDDATGGQARPGGGQESPLRPSPGDHTGSAEERIEVLSALPPDGLLAGPPRFAPPPLPEPSMPSQPRRRSLFRSRGAGAPSQPTPDDGAVGGAGRQLEQDGTMLPPLEELDFRAQPRRAPPAGTAAGETAPAEAPAVKGAAPPAVSEMEPPAMAEAKPPAVASMAPEAGAEPDPSAGGKPEPHAGTEPAPPPTDLEATVPLGPPQAQPARRAAPTPPAARAPATSAPPPPEATETAELRGPHGPPVDPGAFGPPRRKVALSDAERAELGLAAAPAATSAPAPSATSPPTPAKAAPATLEAVEEAFAGTTDREEVGRILLGFLAQSFRRVALFQTNRGQITAWMARGDGIDPEAFERYTASFKEPSVFLNLRQGSGIHIGPLPPMAAHRELALCWGGGLPRDCVVLPVRLRDRLVSVIYVDGGSRGLAAVDLDRMNRLAAATAAAFERCILHKKFGYPQS